MNFYTQTVFILLFVLLLSGVTSSWSFKKLKFIQKIKKLYYDYYDLENCESKWIDSDLPNLSNDLNNKLHGQHLVKNIVTKLVQSHIQNDKPSNALVLSFHGWTGSGKNFVSSILAKNIYKKYRESEKSDHVHIFLCTRYQHIKDIQLISYWIQNNITETVKKCEKSLFIFDEMDKLPEGVIDAIKPFIDFNAFVDSVDYRKSIFILMSNTGGDLITKKVYEFYENGKQRQDITWKDLEPLIKLSTFNEEGGLKNSDIVAKNLIDAFVPFLPLEKRHIKQCITDYLKERYNRDSTEEFLREVSDEIEYYPPDTQIYSRTGCKIVGRKVDNLF